ncbi:MAG: pyridoxal phosphate-dependent aminotransferase [Anaerorhabdus sp.]
MKYENYLSDRVEKIPQSGIRKFFDLASATDNVVSLGVGEPDFPTPWEVRNEAIDNIKKGNTFYSPSIGMEKLRKELCNYYDRRFNIKYEWDKNVIVTAGASEAIDVVLRAIINPGDEVIILTPGYVAYEPCITLSSGTPVTIELTEEEQFKLTAKKLKNAITKKTKALIINYPCNPTGATMNSEDYRLLIDIIKDNNLIVISDEIYSELTYDDEICSIAKFNEIKDQVIIINGFSKAYSMTGWRLGYIFANEIFIKAFSSIHEYAVMCASTISQFAGIKAIKNGDSDCEKHRDSFAQRRNYIVNGLNRIGLKCTKPRGAFYVFASIRSFGLTSEEFCERLLLEYKVAVVPGVAFGECGEGYIRISYAYSIDEIKEALDRMEKFLKSLK